MAGEMSQADVTREEFPEYFAAADLIGGEVRAFDVYQGPYIRGPKGKYWMCSDTDGCTAYWYNERTGNRSREWFTSDENGAEFAFADFAIELEGAHL